MSLLRTAALRGALTAAVLSGAAFAAPSALAGVNVNSLTSYTTEAEDIAYRANTDGNPATIGTPRACPLINVVIARGTDEPKDLSPALDGWMWNGWTNVTGAQSQWGTWNRIAKELFNPTDGSSPTAYDTADDILRTDLSYAATTDFLQSIPSGTVRLMNYLEQVSARCDGTPGKQRTRFVLLGFSQGAIVVGNALAIPTRREFWPSGSQALTPQIHNRIEAVGLLANPGFNPGFNSPTTPSQHAGALITSGYAANSIPDVGKQMNDGNFDPQWHGPTGRALDSFPVKSAADATHGQMVSPGLTENVEDKIRDYCVKRDWACQNTNPNNEFNVHMNTAWDNDGKRNLAIWAIEKIRS